ncbi:release factor glutamine methyltransferase [Flexibacter flexilis DSM 6793]|uniref:peptide chain release factor N(5)-glutamine methyltransferase n=1 Tax=Flexibacter flexilis DSM 6793 TaxID=927664 RepID=A0A1I1I0T7_9BACT|nr:peptide chain release factor N(5)-glutamine methyltransferase [Flexibacter flexilis]SFC29422.1 release factor glutamine methyltransferase [Flexibacter flexilis DSM 6793]
MAVLISDLHQQYSQALQSIYPTPEADTMAWWLLEHYAHVRKQDAILRKEIAIQTAVIQEIQTALARLLRHEPIQYVLGETEFYGLVFEVNEATLIPRPETEEIVYTILQKYKKQTPPQTLLDVGTGSGCIAVTLSAHWPQAQTYAWDISPKALETATRNAARNNATVTFRQTDILNPEDWQKALAPESLDLLVSNPPYITLAEKSQMRPNVLDYEPETALFVPDEQPLLFYEALAQAAAYLLKPQGYIFLEINEQFAPQTAACLRGHGFENIVIQQDMRGKDRLVYGQKC